MSFNNDTKGLSFADISLSEYVNIGRECLTPCNGNQGSCSYCGTKGMCCTHKSGWTDTSNGCDGSFGGTTTHLCSVKKTVGMVSTDIFQFSQRRLVIFNRMS